MARVPGGATLTTIGATLVVIALLVPPSIDLFAQALPAQTPAGTAASSSPASLLSPAADAGTDLPRLHSLLVSRRGVVLLERYYNGARATRPANIKSASKSVMSALVGIAIDRRLIPDVKQRIVEYFPEHLAAATVDARKRQITIEDLLTMRSGLEGTSNRNYGAWVQSPNWVRHALNRPMFDEPGSAMEYSTGNTHLLSAILTRAAGTSTWQFAQNVLAAPLGFTLSRWPQDPQGVYFGGNDMLMTPRQMLAFGELYWRGGRTADGKQVVPESWVKASFVPRVQSDREDDRFYGYGWWIRKLAGYDTYYAWGYGGQYIFVLPALDLVVVTTSASTVSEERRSHRQTVFDVVERLIVEPVARLD